MTEEIPESHKNKILSIVEKPSSIICLSLAKIYTASFRNPDSWVDSNLKGFLCYALIGHLRVKTLIMFEEKTFEILFLCELYKGFEKNYQILKNNFHCFETNNSFIGFKFNEEICGHFFSFALRNFTEEIYQNLLKNVRIKKKNLRDEIKANFYENLFPILKNKLINQIKKGDCTNSIQNIDQIEIFRESHFNILDDFKFSKETNKFLVNKFSYKLKEAVYQLKIEKNVGNNYSNKLLNQILYAETKNEKLNQDKNNISYIELSKILKTNDMDSVGVVTTSFSYKKSILNQKNNYLNSINNFIPIVDFIENQIKKSEISAKNENLPLHKKILFKFPKIPLQLSNDNAAAVIQSKGEDREVLSNQIQFFKQKTFMDEKNNEISTKKKSFKKSSKFRKSSLMNNTFQVSALKKEYSFEDDTNEWTD